MCFKLRYTASRGLWLSPSTLARIRLCTACRTTRRVFFAISLHLPAVPRSFLTFAPKLRQFNLELFPGLPGFELQFLIGIPDALPLIRVRPPEASHVGCDLAHLLPVNPGYRYRRLVLSYGLVHSLYLDINALRNRKLNGVRIAKIEYDPALLDFSLIAHSNYVELPRISVGHSSYCVLQQCPGQSMKRRSFIGFPLDCHLRIRHLERDPVGNPCRQRALGPRNFGEPVLYVELNPFWYRYRLSSYPRHFTPLSKQRPLRQRLKTFKSCHQEHPFDPNLTLTFNLQPATFNLQPSIYPAKDLASDFHPARIPVSHYAFRGRHDIHSYAAQHFRDSLAPAIHPAPGL